MKTAEERAREAVVEMQHEERVYVCTEVLIGPIRRALCDHEAAVRADEREACAQIADEYTRGVNHLRQRRETADRRAGRAEALATFEANVRTDERTKALAKLRLIRAGVAKVAADATWTTDEVLEEIDGIIRDVNGSST